MVRTKRPRVSPKHCTCYQKTPHVTKKPPISYQPPKNQILTLIKKTMSLPKKKAPLEKKSYQKDLQIVRKIPPNIAKKKRKPKFLPKKKTQIFGPKRHKSGGFFGCFCEFYHNIVKFFCEATWAPCFENGEFKNQCFTLVRYGGGPVQSVGKIGQYTPPGASALLALFLQHIFSLRSTRLGWMLHLMRKSHV